MSYENIFRDDDFPFFAATKNRLWASARSINIVFILLFIINPIRTLEDFDEHFRFFKFKLPLALVRKLENVKEESAFETNR